MNPVQLLDISTDTQDLTSLACTSSISMSSNIVDSLAERPSRPTRATAAASLRSASLPPRDASEPHPSPRLTPTARTGEPLRPARARTPVTTPATPALGRDAPTAVQQLQRQLDDTRAQLSQLALTHQLVESNARTAAVQAAAAAVQAASDARIQELQHELELANAARLPPSPAPPAASSPADVLALNLALHNLNAWVSNPELVKPVALGVIITVKNVSDMCAALFKLLGNLPGAQLYEKYLGYILGLPRPGAEDTDTTFANSAACASLNAAFGISDRPSSPDTESVASTSASTGSDERLIRENALRIDAVLSGDVQPSDGTTCPSIGHFQTADALLLQAARHTIKADPGSAVWDSTSDARTLMGAVLSLLKCAGHNADQTRQRRMRGAFGPCMRYPILFAAHGGASVITFDQIAQTVVQDYLKRTAFIGQLNFNYLAAELALAGMPVTSAGSRQTFTTEVTQSVMKLAAEDALDSDTFADAVNNVLQRFRHVQPTGTFRAADANELSKVLCLPRPAAVAAAAVLARPAPAKRAKGKGSSGLPASSSVPPTAGPSPTGPGRPMCPQGADCCSIVLEWDPTNLHRTRVVENCKGHHEAEQYKQLLAAARRRLAPPSQPPPPAPPIPAAAAAAPTTITPDAHSASVQAYIRQHQPTRPACTLLPVSTAAPIDVLRAALDGYNSALTQFATDERSIPSFVPSPQLARFCADHGGKTPRDYHDGIISLWEAYLGSLAADLPPTAGVAFLAASANVKKVLLLDSGSGSNIGPYLPSSGSTDDLSDTPCATSPLREAPSVLHVQTAGGDSVALAEHFDCEMFVRDEDDTLFLIQMVTNNVPALCNTSRALFVLSTDILLYNGGENVNRSREKGGSYFKLQYSDPDYPDGRKFMSGKIRVNFQPLGAAEITIAVRRPDESYFVAALTSPASPGGSTAAVALRHALRIADLPTLQSHQPPALVAVRISDSLLPPNSPITPLSHDGDSCAEDDANSPITPLSHDDGSCAEDAAVAPTALSVLPDGPVSGPAPDSAVPQPRLQQFIADQHLLNWATEMVEIVEIYPLHDEFDVELPRDQFYSATPDYFAWDDRLTGGVHRRMIQRSSRQMALRLPAPTYAWLGCTAAQLLAELEQQLSMLVQGPVKARSDAVDGDGAAVTATEADDADDPSATDTAVAPAAPSVPPGSISPPTNGAIADGVTGTSAVALTGFSLRTFFRTFELQLYTDLFESAGYMRTDLLTQGNGAVPLPSLLARMRRVEQRRLMRLLATPYLLPPGVGNSAVTNLAVAATHTTAADPAAATFTQPLILAVAAPAPAPGVVPPAPNPASCRAHLVRPRDRRGPDDDGDDVVDGSARVPPGHVDRTPAPSATAADTPAPATGAEVVRPARPSDLTDQERLLISHDVWCGDINERPAATTTGIAFPAVRIAASDGITDDSPSTITPGRFGLLADAGNFVPPAFARLRPTARHAATAAAIFVLCMCAHQLPGRPCLGRPALGSVTCTDCLTCSDGRPCVNSARPPFCSAIVPPARYQWPTGAPKAVFLDPAAGTLSYSIARLTDAPTAIALAWDVLPPAVALADMVRAYPHLLSRTIYVQVIPGTLITPELVTDMLTDLCDAAITDVVEMMCGPPCTTTTCRSGRRKNPHRRRIDGVLRPVTYEGAVADVFYESLFATIRFIRSANSRCSFILENPAGGLLRELPQMQALLADIPVTFVVHDHCVLACTPIDHWHGSTQKPTQYAIIGYDPDILPVSLRCDQLGCPHRLSLEPDACHCLVQQLPAKRHRQAGQLRVCTESAARIPVGAFLYAFPLSARLHPAPAPGPTAQPMTPIPTPTPADLPPYGAYLGLRLPADHRLRRLTPLTCVYNAATLHAVCGHTLRGQRLADSANQWQGFRMLSASGQILSAPNITAADVRLDAHCDICTRTQMQAAPSHQSHPRAGRHLPAVVACPAPFGLADISTSFLGISVPYYSAAVPTPTWGQWPLPAVSPPLPPYIAMPALTPTVETILPREEGEAHFSDSSDFEVSAPGRCPDSSDSDAEAERDVDTIPTNPNISDRIFTHPHARGPDCRTFADLEGLPDDQRARRLIHFDIIHSELASPGRPLKAGVKSFLVCVDVGTYNVGFRPLRSTKCIDRAYRELAIEQGWTSSNRTCHCVTDGEPGLMAPVRAAAAAMGQSFDTLPPYAANANHAGSHIIKHIRAAVRGFILGASEHAMSVIDASYEAYAWAQAVLMHNMTSIVGHPLHYSPYRLAHGTNPVFTSVPFGAKVYIHIPKDSRAGARIRGDNAAANRSEAGAAIGPRSQRDSLPLVLTGRNTTKASRTTYLAPDDSPLGVLGVVPPAAPVPITTHVDAAIAAVDGQIQHNRTVKAIQRATKAMFTAHDDSIILGPGPLIDRAKLYIARRCKEIVGLSISAALASTFLTADGTAVRYRRPDLQWDLDHDYLTATLAVPPAETSETYDSECAQAAHLACLALPGPDPDPITYACPLPEQRARIDALVSIVAMSDLPWKAFLKGPECAQVTAAWYRELNALLDLGALVALIPGSPDWEEAVKSKTTTPCRVLLDFKRDGTWKCRVVTRGDLEDKVALDGPDFHYYSNVSRISTVRCAALRADRDTPRPGRTGGRVISTCDIANAFLQTTPFPETERRFLMIRSPIDGTVTYYRQLISVYGSCSASARWETTFSSWLCSPESEGGPGLIRGMNEPSAYYHPGRDLLMVLYTDDQLLDGYKEDIEWYYSLLRARFKIKEPKWLSPDNPIDHLGVGIFMTESHTYMTMENYIRSMNIVLQRDPSKFLHRKSPIPHKHEIVDMTPLSHTKEAFFVRALGMCSWISATVRLDGRYAQSRIAQYASAPCVGAYNALIHLLDYYTTTATLCLRQSRSATSD